MNQKCCVCGKYKRTVEMRESARQLIFGGFQHYKLVPRCQKCETNLAKKIEKMVS